MSKSFATEERLRKPVMRHFIRSQARVHIAIALSISAVTGVLYKLLVNYDLEKEFERMRNAGVFQSAAPDEEEEDDL
uniref:(California timema) hypothetical protein n=1 Tax=Timema californicum TaxID=61474 RepID=A0A7R9P6T1_TIMCA|nr:unnamed protein product [Timema californicum]